MNMVSPLWWTGGKATQSATIRKALPKTFTRFVEAFAGTAAMSFSLLAENRVRGHEVHLNDTHKQLIEFWQQLRDHPAELVDKIYELRRRYGIGNADLFQLAQDDKLQDINCPALRSAMFYARNRLTVMGIQGGATNLTHPLKSKRGLLKTHIDRLSAFGHNLQGATITNHDYQDIKPVSTDTLIYADSPYPKTENRNREYYGEHRFDYDEYVEWCHSLKNKCPVLISIDNLDQHIQSFQGWEIHRIPVYYHSRHQWDTELVITNYHVPFSKIWCSDPAPKKKWEKVGNLNNNRVTHTIAA